MLIVLVGNEANSAPFIERKLTFSDVFHLFIGHLLFVPNRLFNCCHCKTKSLSDNNKSAFSGILHVVGATYVLGF